ncbi:substrate-binding domain-containing protein [Aurantimonas sp. HBX-1]|uniref:substrate-binding domain-containing protein n=1 Tax=Aurantimonas sp. HBX-1 TaxID=2906072 RepID=UPI001F161E6F|nr:substrate-binding domain-containing protein [Aurantimonas sp. HBX-1]UIJ71015.1 substrate-binding domain-containing protein [Aurantimonas sp. HBX-1]
MARWTEAGPWLLASGLAVLFLGAAGAAEPQPATAEPARDELRVCADPNNMPFSNERKEGFENKLAELVGRELGMEVSYTWRPQRRGFIRNTLNAGICDVIMGVPPLDMLRPTHSYYASTYVMVSRAEDGLDFSSIQAPELRHLKIGVHLIGDDGANTPAAEVLGRQGIVDNVVGYSIQGDYREDSPPSRLVEAVASGEVDVAFVWGPLAGYYALQSQVPLKIVPVTGTEPFMPFVFRFPVGMGVRKGDEELWARLNDVISSRRSDIDALLDQYGVPRV